MTGQFRLHRQRRHRRRVGGDPVAVTEGGRTVEDAVWTYREPFSAVAPVAGHVAFYPNKADVTVGA